VSRPEPDGNEAGRKFPAEFVRVEFAANRYTFCNNWITSVFSGNEGQQRILDAIFAWMQLQQSISGSCLSEFDAISPMHG
jgi:hypothetical protein